MSIVMEIEKNSYFVNWSVVASEPNFLSLDETEQSVGKFLDCNNSKLNFNKTVLWAAEFLTLLPYCKLSSRLLDRALIAADKRGAA